MKVPTKRFLAALLLLILALTTLPVDTAYAAGEEPADMLYTKINEARASANKALLAQSDGLEKIAAAYARALCEAGAEFRKETDFKTLPNGDRVFSLTAALGVQVTGFSYSVFFGKSSTPETTNEFRIKVIEGDFTRVGVAIATGTNGAYATVIVYDKTPVMQGRSGLYGYEQMYEYRFFSKSANIDAIIDMLQIPPKLPVLDGLKLVSEGDSLTVYLALNLSPGEQYTIDKKAEMQDFIILFALTMGKIDRIEFIYTQRDYSLSSIMTREQANRVFGDEIALYTESHELFVTKFADQLEALEYSVDVKSTITYDDDIIYEPDGAYGD